MSKVLVPLATGFEEIEAVTIIDVLRRAEIDVEVTTISFDKHVKGANGITIMCDKVIDEIDSKTLDMIVLPGGVEGTYKLADDENIQRILKEMDSAGKNIGAICAAPFALNKAGVLKHNYTCYPSFEEFIREDGYMADKAMVVEDGNVMTSRGPATAMCFALQIVKKLKGEETYQMLKGGLLAEFCED
jgi:4-methyl-5(b-hydroxyethyl)-thiazole monophosphate biosynthesis